MFHHKPPVPCRASLHHLEKNHSLKYKYFLELTPFKKNRTKQMNKTRTDRWTKYDRENISKDSYQILSSIWKLTARPWISKAELKDFLFTAVGFQIAKISSCLVWKSEIIKPIAIDCDAAGITYLASSSPVNLCKRCVILYSKCEGGGRRREERGERSLLLVVSMWAYSKSISFFILQAQDDYLSSTLTAFLLDQAWRIISHIFLSPVPRGLSMAKCLRQQRNIAKAIVSEKAGIPNPMVKP